MIGIPNERWLQDVKAVVVLEEGSQASEAELIDHCKGLIASYKKPKTVEFVSSLPRQGTALDYDALDATFGGGNYPGGTSLGAGK